MNGDETDEDCGGGTCLRCVAGQSCSIATDCAVTDRCVSGEVSGTCTAPTCEDDLKNGDETDKDCGGECGASCEAGKTCDDSFDCAAGGSCTSSFAEGARTCVAAPTCTDTVTNGAETDVDCGGGTCPRCVAGQACSIATDCSATDRCVSGEVSGTCTAPTCDDGVQNGAESAADCGKCPNTTTPPPTHANPSIAQVAVATRASPARHAAATPTALPPSTTARAKGNAGVRTRPAAPTTPA